ncbi:hypothetical protein [Amycolatopsis sp. lyj-90]|uniref:hypothetical protein n=1 Tax=Amycolatopsis sp. lyj-90 TaxID=2789285 RepID=UPI00397C7BFE
MRLRDALPTIAAGADTFDDDVFQRLADGTVSRLSLHKTADTTVLTLAVDHAFPTGA